MQIVTYDKTCKVHVTETTRRNWKINSGSRLKKFSIYLVIYHLLFNIVYVLNIPYKQHMPDMDFHPASYSIVVMLRRIVYFIITYDVGSHLFLDLLFYFRLYCCLFGEVGLC